eukprot:4806346-Pyramimonas_sp.AAC.1
MTWSFRSLLVDKGLPGVTSSEFKITLQGRSGVEGAASNLRLTNSLNSWLSVRAFQSNASGCTTLILEHPPPTA